MTSETSKWFSGIRDQVKKINRRPGAPSAVDKLREARRLLARVVYSCDPRGEGIDEHDCQNIVSEAEAFLGRTSQYEVQQEPTDAE